MSGVTFVSKTGTPVSIGTIILWYGTKAAIPVGWAYYSPAAGYWVKGAIAANATPQNTNDPHTHTYSNPAEAVADHNHSIELTAGTPKNAQNPGYYSGGTINAYWADRYHTHPAPTPTVSAAGGHSHPLSSTGNASVKPPSIGLFYIRKVS